MNFLIAVTIRNPEGQTERQVYRVPPEATMMDVVNAARQRSELTGALWCKEIEMLGTLQPHLYGTYVELLDPRDVTDMVENNHE